MTREEAIRELKINKEDDTYVIDDKAIDIAIKALEKQIPQKPEYIADGYSDGELVYDMAKCPNCGNDDYEYDYGNWGKPFCPECGQALDWSKEE